MSTTPDPFAAPGGTWQPVSPALAGIRRTTSLLAALVLLVPACTAAWFVWRLWWPPVLVAAVVLPYWLWRFARARRWVEAWAWCERDEDLCLRSGLFLRRLTIVPFGRLQLVKVSAGPLLRRAGLASVELVTATSETNAHIPGLPADVAAALRDRLIEATDAHGSGL